MTSEHGQGAEGTAGKEVIPVTGHSTPGHLCLAQGWPMTPSSVTDTGNSMAARHPVSTLTVEHWTVLRTHSPRPRPPAEVKQVSLAAEWN